MGFSVGYSEMSRLLLNLLFLLGHLRRLSSWLTGAPDILLDLDYTTAAAAAATSSTDIHHHYGAGDDHDGTRSSCCGLVDLEEHSPALRFDALLSSSSDDHGGAALIRPDGCAVCLADFHAAARVRRPRGCRHVFHRACLDRWASHGHSTCPLCRAPLLPLPPAAAASVVVLP